MPTRKFIAEEIEDLKVGVIARKHRCSEDYVRRIFKGDRQRNTELGQ